MTSKILTIIIITIAMINFNGCTTSTHNYNFIEQNGKWVPFKWTTKSVETRIMQINYKEDKKRKLKKFIYKVERRDATTIHTCSALYYDNKLIRYSSEHKDMRKKSYEKWEKVTNEEVFIKNYSENLDVYFPYTNKTDSKGIIEVITKIKNGEPFKFFAKEKEEKYLKIGSKQYNYSELPILKDKGFSLSVTGYIEKQRFDIVDLTVLTKNKKL